MKYLKTINTGKRINLRTLFSSISLLFFLFFTASQLYQIKIFKNTLAKQYYQSMSILAELVVTQSYDKVMKIIFQDAGVISNELKNIHINVMNALENNPDLTLEDLKSQYSENGKIELYRFDTNMTVIDTTYPPDLGINLSFLKEFFDQRKVEKTINVTQLPGYEPMSGNYMYYSIIYRPEKNDFLQLSWTQTYDSRLSRFRDYLKLIPNIKNLDVFLFDTNTNQMESVFRYVDIHKIRTKQEYIAYSQFDESEATRFYFQNQYKSSQIQTYYNSDTKEFIYEKLLDKVGNDPRVVVRIVFDAKAYDTQIQNAYFFHGIWFTGTLTFIVIILYALRKRIIYPITKMAQSLYLKSSLPPELSKHEDEIGDIAHAYNQVLSDLSHEIEYSKQLLHNQDRFIRNSIHEVNTPLTIISLYSELLQIEIGENPNTLQIEAGVRILKNTFEDLSYLIKRETQPITPIWIDLNQFVHDRIEFFSIIAKVNTKMIVLNGDHTCNIFIDSTQLQRLVDNTLSNAIKYSALHTLITVDIKGNDRVELVIENKGEIIADKEKIFNLYARENNAKGGYGIGLSIVKDICEENRIIIEVESSEASTSFRYIFPKGDV